MHPREKGQSFCIWSSGPLMLLWGRFWRWWVDSAQGKDTQGPLIACRKLPKYWVDLAENSHTLSVPVLTAEQKSGVVGWQWGSGPSCSLLAFGLSKDASYSKGICTPWPEIASLLLGPRCKKTWYKKCVIKRTKYWSVPVVNGRERAQSAVLLLLWISE